MADIKLSLYPHQREALNAITSFLESDKSVFILRGYAGTGKTTLLRAIVPAILNIGKIAYLMAPTGRATKVLKERVGYGQTSTIHRAIYSMVKTTSHLHDENGNLFNQNKNNGNIDNHKDDGIGFWFDLRKEPEDGKMPCLRVYIADEASMISSKKTENEILHFGTDIVLNDLLTYAQLGSGGKIIFVGDPVQLPPVGDNRSAALEDEFFASRGISFQSFDLTEVIRQREGSAILNNASMVRNCLESPQRNSLAFIRKRGEVEDITTSDVVKQYTERCPMPSIGEAVVICFSNNLARLYNNAIRETYFPDKHTIQNGDILQVCRNCRTPNVDGGIIYNGDFLRVLDVSQTTEKQSAPVWTNIDGNRCRVNVQLTFRDIVAQTEYGQVCNMKIVDSLLNGSEPRLTAIEQTSLYVNFKIRHPELKEGSETFNMALTVDPYFNALNAKYGYAITGHKSQGGEWDTVFVDYTQRTGLDNDTLHWVYTTTTRAKKQLYGVNLPNIQPFDKLKFSSITKLSKAPSESVSLADVGNVGYLPDDATSFQKAKCLSVQIALRQTPYRIENIERLQYKDRYHITTPNSAELYDCTYNGAGTYTAYNALKTTENTPAIIAALKCRDGYMYKFGYKPETGVLSQLYANICSACDELGITMTNVVAHTGQYYIAYYFITSGIFSLIKFYFDKAGFVTYGQAASDIGEDDTLLQKLIKKLS